MVLAKPEIGAKTAKGAEAFSGYKVKAEGHHAPDQLEQLKLMPVLQMGKAVRRSTQRLACLSDIRSMAERHLAAPMSLNLAKQALDRTRLKDVVRIEKEEEVGYRLLRPKVSCGAGSLVLLAKDADPFAIGFQKRACAIRRAVVHYDDIHIVTLRKRTVDCGGKEMHPVEGGDDNTDGGHRTGLAAASKGAKRSLVASPTPP